MVLNQNREAERRIQEAIETRIAARYERILRRELRLAARDAAEAYKTNRSIDSAIAAHDDRVERALVSMWTAAFEAIGERTADQIDKVIKRYRPERKQMSDAFRRGLSNFIRRWAAKKIVQISSTTSKQIADISKRGIEDGLSVDDIAGLIAQRGAELAGYRANLIARTEVHSAAQAGSLEAAKDSGVVDMKEWIAVEDDRTRDGMDNDEYDHTDVRPVLLNERFRVPGQSGDAFLEFPGDPSGPAGSIINCRCAMTYIVR